MFHIMEFCLVCDLHFLMVGKFRLGLLSVHCACFQYQPWTLAITMMTYSFCVASRECTFGACLMVNCIIFGS
jgi:hypothetical protein